MMARPLEILGKMLDLEARDYAFRDRAVAGGLSRYADTWRREATALFGLSASPWIEDVATRLEAYSSLDQAARREMVAALQRTLEAGPEEDPPRRAPKSEPVTEARLDAEAISASAGPSLNEVEARQTEPAQTDAAESRIQEKAAKKESSTPPPREMHSLDRRAGRGLDASVTAMSGIGEKRRQLLARLEVTTIRDFLRYYPRRYEDYSQLKTVDQLVFGERVSLLATVWEAGGRTTHSGPHIFRAILSDTTGTIEVTWFNQPHLAKRIRPGMQLLVSGKVDEYLGRLTMNAPEFELVGRTDVTNARILPVYSLTEGLTQRWMRSAMRRALDVWADRIPDALPDELRATHGLLPLSRALWGIHLPDSQEHLAAARRRLAFEEALHLQLGLLRRRSNWKAQPAQQITAPIARLENLRKALPYELTGAQRRSLEEMVRDMASGEPMHRLLQGDVGSGKTAVAALLLVLTADAGYQAAMMAPTEILAEQHYKNLTKLLAHFPEPRPTLGLLTGSVIGTEREEVYGGLADGSLQVVVGTHALIQETVEFQELALVVIDEQHRFGVEQRGSLRGKGYNPHLLVMTATPIPRSLELTVWGHVDVSVIDEMPPGRQPVRTRVMQPRERGRAYTFIQKEVDQGRQAFIIYPLIEASEKIDARAAVDEHERLQKEVFPKFRLGLLHGRMRADEKDAVMSRFVDGEIDVLIATSVVEVGIDVPNATVMLIDGAERFGLAQLHQFRGRVGRGGHQSHCLLLAESGSAEARERLAAVAATNDGFLLAEKDLDMRGPGEFLGTQQSGFPSLPMAVFANTRLLHSVRQVAQQLLERDPGLSLPEHRLLHERVSGFWEESEDLS